MAKPKILIVDDRPDGIITLEAVLKASECEIHSASSGQEALARVLENDYAVIIMDVQMPGMDGFEAARHIRQRDQSKTTPIIFVTAISKEIQFIYEGYATGAVDYLFKPFDPIVLKAKVSVFLQLHEKERQLRERAEQLRESEEWNRLIVDSATDIIATTRLDGTITSLNPAFEVLTGFSRKDWLGKPIETGVHLQDVGTLLANYMRAGAGEKISPFETRVNLANGSYLTLESCLRPIYRNGQPTQLLWVARDISARKRVQEEERKRTELERSNKELEEFAYICSHDLQEPLRVVISYSQLLKKAYEKSLDSEGLRYLDFVVDNTRRMARLVRDLLDYSRLGAVETFKHVDLETSLREAISILQPAIESSGAEIEVSGLPQVMGSHSQLTRLFQNLIGNSIKFRGQAPPVLKIGWERKGNESIISISDNGIGFDMKYADSIFMIFRRLHAKEDYEGTGMGLSICKKIVERHGGRMWVTSKAGQGSTFFFSLSAVVENSEEEKPMRQVSLKIARPQFVNQDSGMTN
jgi:PAS domain S-box-containing protein